MKEQLKRRLEQNILENDEKVQQTAISTKEKRGKIYIQKKKLVDVDVLCLR